MKNWLKPIKRFGACEEAVKWGESYATIEEAWQACERGDHMLWLLGRLSGSPDTDSRKKLVFTACQCARLALPHVKEGETRPLKAIETAEAWAKGEGGITLQDVKNAADAAAYAAADAAADVYAAYAADADDVYAAYAAAYAADAAADAARAYAAADDASAYAADAARAAADAVYAADAAAAAARMKVLKQCADIVRENYEAPKIGGNHGIR